MNSPAPEPIVPEPVQPGKANSNANPDHPQGSALTTSQGAPLRDTDHSLKAGPRGPILLQDHHLREKITHFDHERIPERVVHARGAGAHGTFTSYGTGSPHLQRRIPGRGLHNPGLRAILHGRRFSRLGRHRP